MVEFLVNGKIFNEASSRVARIVKSENINIVVQKGMLLLHATSDMHEATHIVPCNTVKSGKVTLNKVTIDSILKGRGDISIKVKENLLSFKDPNSGYRGEKLPTLPFSDAEVIEPKFKKSSWSAETQTAIIEALDACSITSYYEADQLPIYLEKRNNKLLVASADEFHVALCQIIVGKDFEFKPITLPSSYAAIIASFSQEPFKLVVGNSHIKIVTETFSCSLPSLQMAQSVTLDQALSLLEISHKASFKGNIKVESIKNSLDNLGVVYQAGAGTNLHFNKGKLTISFSTEYGNTQDTLSVEGECKDAQITLNSENFDDLLSRMSGVVEMKWYKGFGAQMSKKTGKGSQVDYFVSAFTDVASEKIKNKAARGGDDDGEE